VIDDSTPNFDDFVTPKTAIINLRIQDGEAESGPSKYVQT